MQILPPRRGRSARETRVQVFADKLIVNGALVGFAGASIVLLALFLLTAP